MSQQQDQPSEDGFPVELASGATFTVLTPGEVAYLQERVQSYQEQFHFANVSDLQDVDQVVVKELFIHRWSLWISKQKDYFSDPVDEQSLRKSINDFSSELRQLKKQVGIDKTSRDKERGDGSVADYLEKLRHRAKEFGVAREEMLTRGLTLSHQLLALYTLHKNCDEQERLEQRCTAEDVITWIGDVFQPEFNAVDEHFRTHSQRFWIVEQ